MLSWSKASGRRQNPSGRKCLRPSKRATSELCRATSGPIGWHQT
jgi:hypothetical protein